MARACLRAQKGHDNWVRSVQVGNAGKNFYSCSDDKSVRVWDFNSGRNTKTIADAHSVSRRAAVCRAACRLRITRSNLTATATVASRASAVDVCAAFRHCYGVPAEPASHGDWGC